MKHTPWTAEQLSELARLYPTTRPALVVEATGHSLRSVYSKACALGIKSTVPRGPKPGYVPKHKLKPRFKSTPCLPPTAKPAKPIARGPAYLDGPLIFTEKTRHVVCGRTPDPIRTQTFSMFGG